MKKTISFLIIAVLMLMMFSSAYADDEEHFSGSCNHQFFTTDWLWRTESNDNIGYISGVSYHYEDKTTGNTVNPTNSRFSSRLYIYDPTASGDPTDKAQANAMWCYPNVHSDQEAIKSEYCYGITLTSPKFKLKVANMGNTYKLVASGDFGIK